MPLSDLEPEPKNSGIDQALVNTEYFVIFPNNQICYVHYMLKNDAMELPIFKCL